MLLSQGNELPRGFTGASARLEAGCPGTRQREKPGKPKNQSPEHEGKQRESPCPAWWIRFTEDCVREKGVGVIEGLS